MSDTEYTKAVVQQAIDAELEAVRMYEGPIDQSITELQALLNSTRKAVETTQRNILTSIAKMREGKNNAESVLRGTTGMVAEGISFIDSSDVDASEIVYRLQRVREQLEEVQRDVLGILDRDNKQIIGRLKNAISHLRNYWSVL